MKQLVLCGVIALFGTGIMVGCGDTTSTKTEKTIKTPDGKTTVTEEKKVEKSGDNPPPAEKK